MWPFCFLFGNISILGFHQAGGPITVEKPRFKSKLRQSFHDAAEELGYEFIDPNGAKQTGKIYIAEKLFWLFEMEKIKYSYITVQPLLLRKLFCSTITR